MSTTYCVYLLMFMSHIMSTTTVKSQHNMLPMLISTEVTSKYECRQTKLGETYNGTKSSTAAGIACEYWVNQRGMNNTDFPDGSVQAARNYCRNPKRDPKGIGCYVQNSTSYSYCNVPLCESIVDVEYRNCKKSERGSEYVGMQSYTVHAASANTR